MKMTGSLTIVALVLSGLVFGAPLLHADNYIDEIGRQVAKDKASGKLKEMVKPVDNSSPQTTPAPSAPSQPQEKPSSIYDSPEQTTRNEAHFGAFFGTLMGVDVFGIEDDPWTAPLEKTGSQTFGDSVRNPTMLDLFRNGSSGIGSNINFIRPTVIDNPTLRDEINNNDFNAIRSSLQSLGFSNGDFRIERY